MGGVEAGGWFVHEEDAGSGEECLGDFEPALIAVGQGLALLVLAVGDPEDVEQLEAALGDRALLGDVEGRAEQRPVERGTVALPPGKFTARLNRRVVRDLAAIRANLSTGLEQLIDVRSRGRFEGTEPDPRPGHQR